MKQTKLGSLHLDTPSSRYKFLKFGIIIAFFYLKRKTKTNITNPNCLGGLGPWAVQ